MRIRKSPGLDIINVLLLLLILLTLAFIWSRSCKSIPASRAESEAVLNVLRYPLELLVGEGNATDHLVRKLAHFFEFGVLGVEISALAWHSRDCSAKAMALTLLLGFLCGAIDETIQAFTGRGNQFSDVLLDFSGFVTGTILLYILYRMLKGKFYQNKINRSPNIQSPDAQ